MFLLFSACTKQGTSTTGDLKLSWSCGHIRQETSSQQPQRSSPPARSLLACGPQATEASAQRGAQVFQSRSLEQFHQLPLRQILLLLLCSTWPRTKLVLLSSCHFLSSLSSPLKQTKKTNKKKGKKGNKTVSPQAADISEMQVQAAQS